MYIQSFTDVVSLTLPVGLLMWVVIAADTDTPGNHASAGVTPASLRLPRPCRRPRLLWGALWK